MGPDEVEAEKERPLTVAWISFFPVEWLPGVPTEVSESPRQHPATWQRVLLNELKSVPLLKLHVIVLRKQFARSLEFEWEGVTFHLIKTPPGVRATSMFWVDTHLIKRALKGIKPDLVHAWGTENGAALVASRLGFPFLVTMQGLMSWLAETVPVNRYMRFAARLEHTSLRRARFVSVESRFGMQYLRERHPHLELRQIEHAPAQMFHVVTRRPMLQPCRFLFVGGLGFAKGGDLLLGALHELRGEIDFVLRVAGEPEPGFAESLPLEVRTELWPRIEFRTNLNSEQVAEELAAAAMMIYPTRVDNSPNAVKEAVVAGVPVVCSAVGGMLDYVVPQKNGLFCNPGAPASLVETIRLAWAHPLFREGRVDAETLAQMREYLSPGRMSRGFLQLYQEAAA